MPLHTVYVEALEQVLSWELPDEVCPDAVASQARFLAGLASDEPGDRDND